MTLAQLIAQFRADARDAVAPHLFSDAQVTGWLNEAENEAAIRARLLHESASSTICTISVTAGQTSYALSPLLYEIDHIGFIAADATARKPVKLISRAELDVSESDWRDRTGPVQYAIQDDSSIRLAFTPEADGILVMEGFRLPVEPLTITTDTPEINAVHHRHLVDWALFRAFSVPDAETLDAGRAASAEARFTAYFGIKPDADLRRSTRQDTQHHIPAFWA
jgi:hypothetical protein